MREFYRSRYDLTLDQYKKLILVAGMRSGKTALASVMGCYEYWDVLTMTNPKLYEYYKLLRNQEVVHNGCCDVRRNRLKMVCLVISKA